MPSVASFMMPAGKAVTACPEDKLRSVVDSLVNEKVGCVVVVDAGKAVGIITKQDVNRFFLSEVRTQPPRPRLSSLSSLNPTQPRKPRRETTQYTPRYAPIRRRNPDPDEQTTSHRPSISRNRKKFSEEFFQFLSSRATPPQIPLDTPVSQVMSTNLHPARPDMHRDDAAELLQREKIHHAVVVNEDGHFVGLFSSWDIARECALDAKVSHVSGVRWVTH